MKTYTELKNDPEFQSLPFETKREVMGAIDAQFMRLTPSAQHEVMNSLGMGVLPEDKPLRQAASEIYTPGLIVGGAVGAGALATPTTPVGMAGAGALGMAGGAATASWLDRLTGLKKPITTLPEAAGDVLGALQTGAMGEMGGLAVGKALGAAQPLGARLGAMAKGAGRKALGYTKGLLSKMSKRDALETIPRANEVAQTLGQHGVFRGMPNTEEMISRTKGLQQQAESQISPVVERLDEAVNAKNLAERARYNKIFNDSRRDDLIPTERVTPTPVEAVPPVSTLNETIRQQLYPKYSGGEYEKEKKLVDELMETVEAHGANVSIKSMRELLGTLKVRANSFRETDAIKANLYQRAYGITREFTDQAVKRAGQIMGPKGQKLVEDYFAGKELWGKTEEALAALLQKQLTEKGNRAFGILDFMLAAGGIPLIATKPGMAAAVVGGIAAKKGIEKYGWQAAQQGLSLASKVLAPGVPKPAIELAKRGAQAVIGAGGSVAASAKISGGLQAALDRLKAQREQRLK